MAERRPECWGTRQDLCRILGLSEAGIDKIRRKLGKPAESEEGPLRFYLPEWMRAWAGYTSGILEQKDPEDEESEDDSGGWLEEKRKWDALRSQNSYLKERGELVPLADTKVIITTIFEHVRRATEQLCPECRDKQDAAVAAADHEFDRLFSDDSISDTDPGLS